MITQALNVEEIQKTKNKVGRDYRFRLLFDNLLAVMGRTMNNKETNQHWKCRV